MWSNPQKNADLVTFTGDILDGNLHYFRAVMSLGDTETIVSNNQSREIYCDLPLVKFDF